MSNTLISAMILMVLVILVLVAILLIVKAAITPKGTISIDINNGKKTFNVTPGGNLMGTLADNQIFLPLPTIIAALAPANSETHDLEKEKRERKNLEVDLKTTDFIWK